jgi:spermidine/putrescine-binding protein
VNATVAAARLSRRALVATAVSGTAAPRRLRAQDRPLLRILGWPGYDDPAVTQGFRDVTGFDVRVDVIFSNDEIPLVLRSGGLGQYDLLAVGNGVAAALAEAELTVPLDDARLPTPDTRFPAFQRPEWATLDGATIAVPFLWGTSPLIYNADHLTEPPIDWLSLLDERFTGRVIVTDDPMGNLFIWNRALGAPDPARVTRQQLADTVGALSQLKRRSAVAFSGNMGEVAGMLAVGPGWLTTAAADGLRFYQAAGGANLRTARPAPGDCSFVHGLAIPVGAPQPNAAYSMIEHLFQPATQAFLSARVRRATVRPDAVPLLDEGTRSLVPYDDLDRAFERSPLLEFPPLSDRGDGIATYLDWVNGWDDVRAAPMVGKGDAPGTPSPSPARNGREATGSRIR